MTIRVHELATNLGLSTAQVLDLLRAMSVQAKGPSSPVEAHHADAIRSAREASEPVVVMTEDRPETGHQRTLELLCISTSGMTRDEWLAGQERIRLVKISRQNAAAVSKELYEAAQLARREANRQRWEGTYEGPREPKHAARTIVVFQGGSPGLGKRH